MKAPVAGEPYFALLESRSDVIGIMVAGGIKLGDDWRVGGGILALAALRGRIFVDVDSAPGDSRPNPSSA